MIAAALLCILASVAHAAPLTAAQTCESSMETASGKYAACRLTAESTFAKRNDMVKRNASLVKCQTALQKAFTKAQTKANGACLALATEAAFDTYLTQCSDDTEAAADGAPLPNYAADLATCRAMPPAQLLKTGQTTSYGAGSDGALQKGIAQGYVENGDGTITDTKTGLMWEKKSDDGTIHDKDNTYTWGMTIPPYVMNGTMVTTFLATLNAGGGFAGHTDWRMPNLNELESIRNLENTNPVVSEAFNTNCGANSSGNPGCTMTTCSCTVSDSYWSSSTDAYSPIAAWYVSLFVGGSSANVKNSNNYVRAVRGSS